MTLMALAGTLAIAWPAAAQTRSPRDLRRTPVVDVFERTRDAVVSIAATQVVERTVPQSMFDEMFGFPSRGRTRRYETTSLGSGFVIHPDGYVVTNAHVIVRAAAQKVIFADHKEYEAERVAIDEKHDLAVLKVKADKPLPAITLGRSDDLMIGETVVAIGNPLGYDHTVTTGIVSAVNRKLEFGGEVSYEGLIQTDASINRGNSGGPLLNVLGELIGINTAIRGDAQNIGFAIPVDSLRKLLPEMLSIERMKRLEVGMRLGWRNRVYVSAVYGPAAAAGIQAGDVVESINGVSVKQDLDYYIYLLRIRPGDRLSMQCVRDGRRFTATIVPKTIPIPDGGRLLREKFGLSVKLLTRSQAQEFSLPGGLIITDVEPGSPAARAGFVAGLIVVQIGNYFPADLDEVGKLLEDVGSGDKMLFRVWQTHPQIIRVLEGYLIAR
jgi:serine protease Do